MEDTTKTTPNILLKRQEEQDLRIYFFIGNSPPQMANPFMPGSPPAQSDRPSSQVFYVVAFKLEEAFELAKVKGVGYNLLFTAQSPTVREFLHELEIESLAHEALAKSKDLPKEEKKELPPPLPSPAILEPKEMNFETFKAGLLFCANESNIIYQNPEDKEALKQIISGLSYRT